MKKAAIIVGHSPQDGGAYNKNIKINEFEYNNRVAKFIKAFAKDVEIEIVYREATYSGLPSLVNATNSDLNISLHCNAYDTTASGFEILSSGSKKSLEFAKLFETNVYYDIFDSIPLRGIKIRAANQRGGRILHKTKAPCILVEPFFIDNDSDLELGLDEIENYARRIVGAIEIYLNN